MPIRHIAGRPHAGDVVVVEAHLTRLGPDMARDQVEQRRLAGSVRADDGRDLPPLDGKADIRDRDKSTEGFSQAADFKHRYAPGAHRRGRQAFRERPQEKRRAAR